MRVISLSVIFISVITVFAFVNAFPTDNGVPQNTLSDIDEIAPDKTPDSALSNETNTSRRVKRSDIIGFIRQICPPLANFLNNVFQQVKKIVFKIIGSLLLGGNKNKPAGGKERPAVVVNLPTYPPDEEDTTEPITSTDSSSSSDSPSSTESTSSSGGSSTSSFETSSKSSSPPSDNSIVETTSTSTSTSTTSSTTTESRSTGQSNFISTNEFQVDELTEDDYHYDC